MHLLHYGFRKVYFLLVISLVLSCSVEDEDTSLFTLLEGEVTGIEFNNKLSSKSKFNIIEYLYYYNGGGVSAGDINNDGLDDLFFTANEGSNKLYLNKGNLQFEDITASAGISEDSEWSTGVTMADINNDGYLDIYISQVSGYKGLKGHNLLYINNGDLTFKESSKELGLDFAGFGTQAVFFDYDLDGDLDVYLLNHSVHSVGNYGQAESLRNRNSNLAGDRLMQNQLAQGVLKFIDVTSESGIYSSPIGYGLGVSAAYINDDHLLDIYVTNDFHENDYLYINSGDGTFKESLSDFIPHTSRYAMGNDVSDINNDGREDIITTDMLPADPVILMKSGGEDKQEVYDIKLDYGYDHQLARNALQLNRGNGKFTDIALKTNTFATDWSWAPLIADLNNDGYQDIFISNGIFKRPNDLDYIQYTSNLSDYRYTTANEDSINLEMIKRMPTLKIENAVFKSDSGRLLAIEKEWGLDEPSYSNGAVYADLDNDGDLDLVINNVNQRAHIYKNNSNEFEPNSNWVKIKLEQSGLNRMALGAKVRLYTDSLIMTKTLMLTRGFQSSVPPYLHFGVGEMTRIDSVNVVWPDGTEQSVKEIKLNDIQLIKKDSSASSIVKENKKSPSLFQQSEDSFDYSHKENINYKDYNSEYLLPYRLSTLGPVATVADYNNDDLDDLFIGGAAGQPAVILQQLRNGEFEMVEQQVFFNDRMFEDIDAVFLDVDNDDDLDLVVASGGYQYNDDYPLLENRLYLNNEGVFERVVDFDITRKNTSCVELIDYDLDGDSDLVFGNNASRGGYGVTGGIQLFENTGNGLFRDVTEQQEGIRNYQGMVHDIGVLINSENGYPQLVVASHWEPLSIIDDQNGLFSEVNEIENSSGFWNTIKIADLDNDGDMDFVVGNIGLNNKFKVSADFPLKLYMHDFDDNGVLDPVIMQPKDEMYVPIFTKDELAKQMPIINKNYSSYISYAEQVEGLNDLFKKDLENLIEPKLVQRVASTVYINENGTFDAYELPAEFQYSSINSIQLDDFNQDGILDILSGGNNYYLHVNLGRLDGDYGSYAFGNGDGTFRYIENSSSGLKVEGQVSKIVKLGSENSTNYIFVMNNDSVQAYTWSQ